MSAFPAGRIEKHVRTFRQQSNKYRKKCPNCENFELLHSLRMTHSFFRNVIKSG